MLGWIMSAQNMNRFIRDEQGSTSIEYALIAAFIFLVIVASVTAVGANLKPLFESVAAAFG